MVYTVVYTFVIQIMPPKHDDKTTDSLKSSNGNGESSSCDSNCSCSNKSSSSSSSSCSASNHPPSQPAASQPKTSQAASSQPAPSQPASSQPAFSQPAPAPPTPPSPFVPFMRNQHPLSTPSPTSRNQGSPQGIMKMAAEMQRKRDSPQGKRFKTKCLNCEANQVNESATLFIQFVRQGI